MAMRFGTRVTVAAMWLLGSLSIMGVAHAASQYPDPSKCSTSPPALVNTGTDPAFPGLWGNPQRIGTGWDIFFNGTQSQAIVYWYTYNAARQPVWLFAGPTNVTADSKGVLQINAPLQQITLVPGSNPVQQSSNVGQVWISFVPGSTTAAAVIWQWNAAGASPQSQECIYNFMHGPQAPSKPVTGNAGGTPLDESYTGNWYNSSQSGWALNISVGIEPDGTNWEVDTAAIYDTAGNPVWLENSQQSPTTQQTTIPLGYYTSNYPGGFPTSDCSTTSCRTATSNANTFVTRSFVNSSQGSAVVSANISAMPKVLWPNTPWYITDPSGDLSLVSIGKISEQNFVAVNQTSCTIPNGQSTCSVVVSWVSASSTGLVYRRNLTDSVLSTTPIGNGNAGSTTDYLGPGADVQYEMHDGSPTGTLLYTSAEVIVPAAQGTTTPVSATPVVAAIPATDTTSDQVGATLAQFRVDESGNATYSIPIQVVPGTAGMTPKVALTYNSRLPNGVMGPGWTIDGASQITRCRQMRESGDFVGATEANGNPLPVNFTQTDRFCLDGVRLLLTSSGTYGASNTTYSPENDPSMRVTATGGTSATGPSNFTVQRKDGTISSYGNTTASPNAVITATLPATGSSVNVAWNLSRVQDSTGNYIDYVYNVQPATQGSPILPYATGAVEYTLSKINYTGHGTTAPYASIIFSYGTISANTRLGYQAGIAFLQSQQLWSVTVQDNAAPGGSQVVRYYDLKDGYAASPSGSGLQVLSKIRECRDSTMTVCYPWTTFTWSQANYALTSAATTTQTGPDFTKLVAYKLADVDGDGRTDVVFAVDSDSHCPNGSAIYVGFSDINSSGQSYLNLAGQTPTCAAFSLKTYDLAWYLVDLDGDGRADLLMGGDGSVGGTWKKYISAGRPASGQPVFATGADFSPVIAIPSTMKAVGLLADVNGDGLPDLIVPDATNPGQISSALGGQLANAGLSVYLMTRQGGALTFAPPYEMVLSFKSTDEICAVSLNVKCTLTFWNTAVSNGSISANDVDGDGRADLTFMLQQTPCTPTTCPNHSVDASNVPIISFNPALGTPNQTTSSQTNYYWMQFTAAGVQPPSVTGMSSNVQLMQEYAFFSTTTFPQLPNLLTNVYAVDLTGDGLSDLLFQDAQDSTQYCFMINLGYGYENPVCQPLPNYQVIGTASNSNLLFADVNGDGKLDVVYPSNLAGNIYGYITLLPSTTTTWAWPSAATAV
ncbi:MAG TPA: SpvB/TcaC N-terminal domain-containing protein, partial [Burkholderiales bacterium]|nr:SpvB/TcaC N-terminal domain-containing protein [Burkholderiales bacterium]